MEVRPRGEGRCGGAGALLSVTVGAASSGAQSLTSAARPILADLKAVSAEAEGAVPCHDAAVAAAQLVAGWQQLCGEEEEMRSDENYIGDGEAMLWEITFWFVKILLCWKPLKSFVWLKLLSCGTGRCAFFHVRIVHVRQLHPFHFARIQPLPMQGRCNYSIDFWTFPFLSSLLKGDSIQMDWLCDAWLLSR